MLIGFWLLMIVTRGPSQTWQGPQQHGDVTRQHHILGRSPSYLLTICLLIFSSPFKSLLHSISQQSSLRAVYWATVDWLFTNTSFPSFTTNSLDHECVRQWQCQSNNQSNVCHYLLWVSTQPPHLCSLVANQQIDLIDMTLTLRATRETLSSSNVSLFPQDIKAGKLVTSGCSAKLLSLDLVYLFRRVVAEIR